MTEGGLLGFCWCFAFAWGLCCGLWAVFCFEKHSDTMGGLRAFDRGLCLLVLYHFCTDVVLVW
jgi:hypothetical protein